MAPSRSPLANRLKSLEEVWESDRRTQFSFSEAKRSVRALLSARAHRTSSGRQPRRPRRTPATAPRNSSNVAAVQPPQPMCHPSRRRLLVGSQNWSLGSRSSRLTRSTPRPRRHDGSDPRRGGRTRCAHAGAARRPTTVLIPQLPTHLKIMNCPVRALAPAPLYG